MEWLMKAVFKNTLGMELNPISRITYDEAMAKYGADNPTSGSAWR
jgi:aspartyl-tRNA synthetase